MALSSSVTCSFVMSTVFELGCEHPRHSDFQREAEIDRLKEINFQILSFHLYLLLKSDLPRSSRQILLFHLPFHRGPSPT